MAYILTIDAGTSSFKFMLWSENGKVIKSCSEELSLITGKPGYVEFPVDDYWQSASEGIRRVMQGSDSTDVKAVVISSQGETLINLDRDGKPLRNAVVWIDERSAAEAALIEKEFGRDKVFGISGQPEVVATWPATKILWQRRNEPEVFKNTAKYLMLEDYLLFKLTGKYIGEYSVHSSTLWLDINNLKLWDEMLDFIGLDSKQLPDLVGSGNVAGSVSAEAAADTGLSRKTLVITGALDQAAGAIGAGNVKPGICSETTGSALAACVFTEKPVISFEHRIPCHCHALIGKYFLMAWGQTAGLALKWFKDNFCEKEMEYAGNQNRDVYDIICEGAARVLPGCEGLVFLPYLSGAACPEFNSRARGVFFGITIGHKKEHFARSILESIAFMLKKNLDLLREMGIPFDELISGGGGSKSALLNQIKADVILKPVRRVLTSETASAGVAVIAGAAVGVYRDIDEGVNTIVKLAGRVSPDKKNEAAYNNTFYKYIRLYDSLVPMFRLDCHHQPS